MPRKMGCDTWWVIKLDQAQAKVAKAKGNKGEEKEREERRRKE